MHRSRSSAGVPVVGETCQRVETQNRDLHQQQRLRAKAQSRRGGEIVGHDEGGRLVAAIEV